MQKSHSAAQHYSQRTTQITF